MENGNEEVKPEEVKDPVKVEETKVEEKVDETKIEKTRTDEEVNKTVNEEEEKKKSQGFSQQVKGLPSIFPYGLFLNAGIAAFIMINPFGIPAFILCPLFISKLALLPFYKTKTKSSTVWKYPDYSKKSEQKGKLFDDSLVLSTSNLQKLSETISELIKGNNLKGLLDSIGNKEMQKTIIDQVLNFYDHAEKNAQAENLDDYLKSAKDLFGDNKIEDLLSNESDKKNFVEFFGDEALKIKPLDVINNLPKKVKDKCFENIKEIILDKEKREKQVKELKEFRSELEKDNNLGKIGALNNDTLPPTKLPNKNNKQNVNMNI